MSEISESLYISINTVATHRDHIKNKLNVKSVSELTCRAAVWVAEHRDPG